MANNNTFLDSSSNNYAITKTGNVGQGTISPFAPSWSSLFAAGGDYINASACNTALGFLANNLTTVEAWIYPTANLAGNSWTHCIIGNAAGVAANSRWGLTTVANSSVSADAALMFWYTTSSSAATQIQTTAYGIKFGKWNHVAMTIDSTTPASSVVTLYINGVGQIFTVNLSNHTAASGTNYFIGGGYWNTLMGHISNLRVVKGSLVYGSDFTVPTSPLVPIDGTVLLTCCSATLSDESSYNNILATGTFTTVVSEFSPFAAGALIPYSPSNSIYFAANGSYLYKANPGNGDFDPGATGEWTFETWFMPLAASLSEIATMGILVSYGNSFELQYLANKTIQFYQGNGSSSTVVSINSITTYALNSWHHIAVAKDASNVIRLFVNGVQVGTATYSSALNTGCGFLLNGAFGNGGLGNTGGNCYISNVRWIKGTCLYNANFYPDTNPLTAVANTKLLVNSSTIVDTSSNNYVFTLAGTIQPYVRQFCPHYSGISTAKSIYFPANGNYLYKANPGNGDFDPGSTGAWTIEFWYMPKSMASSRIMTFGNGEPSGIGLAFIMNSGVLSFQQRDGSAPVAGLSYSKSLYANSWYHIAVAKDSSNVLRLFINGIQVASQTSTGTVVSGCGVVINGKADDVIGSAGNNIYISNLRWVKGTCLYNANFVPPTTVTAIANTKLLLTDSFVDQSSNGYTFTVTGSPTLDGKSPITSAIPTTALTDYKASTFAGSAYFDGNTGYYLSTAASAAFAVGSSNFTLEMWIHPITNTTNTGRIAGILAAVSYPDITWYITGNYIYVAASSNGTSWNVQTPTAIVQAYPGLWMHLSVCRSGNSMYWYVNGVLKLTTNVTGITFHSTSALYVGWDGISGDPTRFRGYISGVRLVKSDLYKTGFLPSKVLPTAVANTSMLMNFANMGVWDASKTSIFETVGSVTTQSSIYKSGTGALSFNGTSDYLVGQVNGAHNQLSGRAFTIEFWIFPTAWSTGTANNEYRCVMAAGSNTSSQGWRIQIGTAAQGIIYFAQNGTGYTGTCGAPISLNAWQHIAFVYDGTNLNVYKNGFRVSGPTAASWSNTSDALFVGALMYPSYPYYFAGYLDNIQISYGTRYITDFSVLDYTTFLDKSTNKVTRPSCQLLLTGDGSTNLQNTTIMDSSVNYAAITRNGNGAMGTFSPFGDNWSTYFDGTDDRIEFPASANYNLSSGDFTVECWIKPSSIASTNHIVGTADPWYNANGWCLFYSSGNLQFGGNSHGIAYTSNPLQIGKWYHVAVCKQGSDYYLFVDGAQYFKSVSTYHPDNENTQPLRIGCHPAYSSYGTAGYISNVRIVKGTALYTAPFTVPTAKLTAVSNTVLLTCQDNIFVDNSQYKAVATLAGGTPYTRSYGPFIPAFDSTKKGSIYFDGSSYLTTGSIGNFNNQAWTVEAWVYISAYNTGTMGILQSVQGKGAWIPYVALFITSTGLIDCTINGTEYTSTTKIDPGTWHHIALERTSGGTVTLYKNGVATNVSRTDNIDSASLTFFVGRCANSNLSYVYNFQGYISNARISLGTARYGAAFTPSTLPLTALSNTKLLTAQSFGLVDKSSGNVSISSTGAPILSDISPFPQYIAGSSVYMNGSSYLAVASNSTLTFGTGDFTLEAWIYRVGSMPNVNIFFSTSVNGGLSFSTTTTSSSLTYFDIRPEGSPGNAITFSGQTMRSEQWHHVVAVRKSGMVAVFLDGKRAQSPLAFTANLVQQDIWVGRSASTYWTGYMSNVRVAKSALYDINQSYIPVPQTHLSAINNTVLLTLADKELVDGSSNAFTVVNNGGKLSDFNPYQTGSIYLDGSSNASAVASGNYAFGTSDFTVEGWFYISGNAGAYSWTMLVTNRTPLGDGPGTWGLTYDYAAGTLAFSEIVTSPVNRLVATVSLKTAWYHLAAVRKSGTLTIYVNGKSVISGTHTNNYTSTANSLIVGQSPGETGMKGYVHGVRIVKGTALYSADFIPSGPALSRIANEVLNLPFQDIAIADASGNFNLLPTGTNLKPSVTVAAKSGATSMYFDGASYLTVQNSNFCFDGDFTIEFWQYRLTPTSPYPIVFCLDNLMANEALSAYNYKMYIGYDVGNGTHSFVVANSALNGWAINVGMTTPSLNAWHHYAITRNGSTWKVFIDGVQAATATYAGTVPVPTQKGFSIGAGSSTSYNKAYIDNFKITIGESLYNTAFTPTY